ncbi:hypothetical protein FJZ31_40325 [Candidatus Poribacteria bacterium]|nr:hypothetical protein [Candidatus Poribacteria bacterium]
MKRNVENIPIEYRSNRVLIGYLYHGDVNADKISMMPFVITDLQKNVSWRIGGDYIRRENQKISATPLDFRIDSKLTIVFYSSSFLL